MWFAVIMLLLQALKIRSAYLFACTTGIAVAIIMVNETTQFLHGRRNRVGFKAGYVLGFAGFIFFAVEAVTNVCPDVTQADNSVLGYLRSFDRTVSLSEVWSS